MKWDEKARVFPKELPLGARLGLAWRISRVVTKINGQPAGSLRDRARVFLQAFTANVIVVEEGS